MITPGKAEIPLVSIGGRDTELGRRKRAERLAEYKAEIDRLFPVYRPNYQDITRRVMESPTLIGNHTDGRKSTRKGKIMPAKITVSSLNSLTGKRGRKSTINYSDWAMENGDVFDITDDFMSRFSADDFDSLEAILSDKDEDIVKEVKAAFSAFKRYASIGSGEKDSPISQSEFDIATGEDEENNTVLVLVRK